MPTPTKRFLQRLPLATDRPWIGYGVTMLLVAVAFLVRVAVAPVLPAGFPFVTFFPAVVIAAFLFGTRPGVVAAVLCGLLSWYFFIEPVRGFNLRAGSAVALLLYAFVAAVDIILIHWMQSANQRLVVEREINGALAATRALLFEELQHRVSNNLQVAAALLSLQKRTIDDAAARRAIDEASRRLALIGRISRRLYDSDGTITGMSEVLRTLYDDVIEASGAPNVTGSIQIDPSIQVSPGAAVPLALIFAESVANAVEHGVAKRGAGVIDVTFRRSRPDEIELLVADDGAGLPPGFSIDSGASLGLKIAQTLAQQLRGTFSLESGAGTTARLVMPA